jgi:hypothetical protein
MMKRAHRLGFLVLALQIAGAEVATPQTAGAGDPLMVQAEAAMGAKDYFRATRLLTAVANQKQNPNSARAQELLGNVREEAGQLAQARAEYEAYLKKYPDGEGAARVQSRLSSILSGAGGTATAGGRKVISRGIVSLGYRYNDGGERPDYASSGLIFDEVFSALTLSLQYSASIDTAQARTKLFVSASGDLYRSGLRDRDPKLSEAYLSYEAKSSGAVFTVGRQKTDPQGIAYRTDGVSVKWPLQNGVRIGFVVGKPVDSTRDKFFEDKRTLAAASVTFEDTLLPGEVSLYAVGQWDGSRLDRNAIGAEYTQEFAQGHSLYAGVEYDLKFSTVNRAQVNATYVLQNQARIVGGVGYYRSPGLSLENALFGRAGLTVDDLLLPPYSLTLAQIEAFALDRSSKVATADLAYFGKLNAKWDVVVDGSVTRISGTPASGGVNAVSSIGTLYSAGLLFMGSSVFREDDGVNVGLRWSKGSDDTSYVLDTSVQVPLNDKLSLRPRLRVGYRDNDVGPNDHILMPSLGARYSFDSKTSFQIDAGRKFEDQNEFFLTAGLSRSF